MENELITYISQFIPLNEEEAKVLAEHNPVRTFEKGTTLLRKDEIVDKCWFVLKLFLCQIICYKSEIISWQH